jgi:hypothetical protein
MADERGGDRPGRFSREWQRERARRAKAEADEAAVTTYWISKLGTWFGPFVGTFWRPRVGDNNTVEPYRGFRAGRARWRPDSTGYDEPVEPAASRDSWHDNPWLADLESGEPVSDGLIDDEYDEPGGDHDERPSR